jgi:hypothetical protein
MKYRAFKKSQKIMYACILGLSKRDIYAAWTVRMRHLHNKRTIPNWKRWMVDK